MATRKKTKDVSVNGALSWPPHLRSFKNLRLLKFHSDKDLEAAIDLLWTAALKEMPHDTAGRKTLIVPAEAVAHFSRARLAFEDHPLPS